MARERAKLASDREGPPRAPPASASRNVQLAAPYTKLSRPTPLAKPSKQVWTDEAISPTLLRIRSCLQTVALLLETNHEYLPIFLRLEQELEAEQKNNAAIERSRKYLPRLN